MWCVFVMNVKRSWKLNKIVRIYVNLASKAKDVKKFFYVKMNVYVDYKILIEYRVLEDRIQNYCSA